MRIEVLSYGEVIYSYSIQDAALKDLPHLNNEDNYLRRQLIIEEHIRKISGMLDLRNKPGIKYCLCFESKLNKLKYQPDFNTDL